MEKPKTQMERRPVVLVVGEKPWKRASAKALAEAVRKAERELENPAGSAKGVPFVSLSPEDVETRTELFQPRTFLAGLREVDPEHVKKLAGRVSRKGELDPPLVIKLGAAWVCVDGHHRLAAYKHLRWSKLIKCEWFGGSVREAADESLRRNETAKLEISRGDRFETAWKRVLLGWGSKAEIVRLTGVSVGTVAHMRRIKTAAVGSSKVDGEFRKRLSGTINETTWREAQRAYLNLAPIGEDAHDRAAKLATRMRARLTNLLSRDPVVTAEALEIYDAALPARLVTAWLDIAVEALMARANEQGKPELGKMLEDTFGTYAIAGGILTEGMAEL